MPTDHQTGQVGTAVSQGMRSSSQWSKTPARATLVWDRPRLGNLRSNRSERTGRPTVIVLGIILIVVGWLVGIGLLETIGLVVAVIGLILLLLHGTGHSVGGRVWY